MAKYHRRESSRTRARKRRERNIRTIGIVLGLAALAIAGTHEWRNYLKDQENRLSDSWRSDPAPGAIPPSSDDVAAPADETAPSESAPSSSPSPATAAAPASTVTAPATTATPAATPAPKKRAGVATLYFGERELISLDSGGRRLE